MSDFDPLEGVTERTMKREMIDRLREASRVIRGYRDQEMAERDARAGKLQEIEDRVREQYAGVTLDLRQVLVTNTPEEWEVVIDFLDNFEGMLPAGMQRILDGARMATGVKPPDSQAPQGASKASKTSKASKKKK